MAGSEVKDKVKTTMKFADRAKWDAFIDEQRLDDPYTATVLAYAVDWAERMEAATAGGNELTKEIAEKASDETRKDVGGMTMSMFGQAWNILVNHWAQGQELRPFYKS